MMQSGWALGYIAAALLSGWILPLHGWRVLFVLGAAARSGHSLDSKQNSGARDLEEKGWPRPLLASSSTGAAPACTLCLRAFGRLTLCILGAFHVDSLLPFHAEVDQGGAGLSIPNPWAGSLPWSLELSWGYLSFGHPADRFGRRRDLRVFCPVRRGAGHHLCARPLKRRPLFILSPFVGFFGHGYFSVFGAMLSELFPTRTAGPPRAFVTTPAARSARRRRSSWALSSTTLAALWHSRPRRPFLSSEPV